MVVVVHMKKASFSEVEQSPLDLTGGGILIGRWGGLMGEREGRQNRRER